MSLSSSSVLEDLKTALDFFFRRRPTLASVMWHTETIPIGEEFRVPKGKIYECFCYPVVNVSIMLNGFVAITPNNGIVCWYPMNLGVSTYGTTVQGEIGTAGMGDTDLTVGTFVTVARGCMSPHGWILSEDDILTSTAVFRVRWREVTHRQ